MEKKYLLGIDVGTSIIKAVVFDYSGNKIGSGIRQVIVESPKPSWAQQSPEKVWNNTTAAIKDAIKKTRINAGQVAAVGPCGQGDGAWMVDDRGEPLPFAILWNDGRASEIVDSWEKSGLLDQIFELNGTQLWPGSATPVLAWLKKNDPQYLDQASSIFCCKDWIKFKLTGTISTDESDGSIPFFNITHRKFDDQLLELTGLTQLKVKLPKIVPSNEVVGEVTYEAAAQTGLKQGTPVVSGMLDVAANAIGAGVVRPGQALSILGTTSLNMIVQGHSTFEPIGIGASACHGVPDKWMRILGAMTGTPNLDWYIKNIGDSFNIRAQEEKKDIFSLLEESVTKVPVGSNGVLFHPFLTGERAPFVNPGASAGFFGINAATTKYDMLRAVYEGITLSTKDCYQKMVANLNEVALVGGGSNSQTWCQMLADALGCRTIVPRGNQLGALGAALCAGVGVGIYTDYEDALDKCLVIEQTYEPSASNTKRYNILYKRYSHLIKQMTPFWNENRES